MGKATITPHAARARDLFPGNGKPDTAAARRLASARLACAIQQREALTWIVSNPDRWQRNVTLRNAKEDIAGLLDRTYKELGKVNDEIANLKPKVWEIPDLCPVVGPHSSGKEPWITLWPEHLRPEWLLGSSPCDCAESGVVIPEGSDGIPRIDKRVIQPPRAGGTLTGTAQGFSEPSRMGMAWDYCLAVPYGNILAIDSAAVEFWMDVKPLKSGKCKGAIFLSHRVAFGALASVAAAFSTFQLDIRSHLIVGGREVVGPLWGPPNQPPVVIWPNSQAVRGCEGGLELAKDEDVTLRYTARLVMTVAGGCIDFTGGGVFALLQNSVGTGPGVFSAFVPEEGSRHFMRIWKPWGQNPNEHL